MTDRRRINGPPGGTSLPVFVSPRESAQQPQRTRKPSELRKIFLKTGLVPSASGSAYLELESPSSIKSLLPSTSTIKLICAVHGPKPLSRNASFSPNLQINASVKFAPFATRLRRGYVRDSSEKDLGSHLESALKAAVIADRWPKSALDVVVTIMEGEEDHWWGNDADHVGGVGGIGSMNVLAGCITVASAALADARIDCLDLLSGGVAATIRRSDGNFMMVLDPCPVEHEEILSACAVGYLPSRDEVTEVWIVGDLQVDPTHKFSTVDEIVDSAVVAARGAQLVLQEAVKEAARRWNRGQKPAVPQNDGKANDIEMST